MSRLGTQISTIRCEIRMTKDGLSLVLTVDKLTMEECKELGDKLQAPVLEAFKEITEHRANGSLIRNSLTGEIKTFTKPH